MDTPLLRTLTDFGLTDKEAKVYLALLELGEGNVTKIAQKTGLKRAITYIVLDRLMQRGYASKTGRGKVLRFTAADPLQLFNSEQTRLSNFKFMLPLMRSLYNTPKAKPRFNYFEGKEAILTVYAEISRFPTARFISSIGRLNSFVPEEVERWQNEYESVTKHHQSMHLLTDTPADRNFAKIISGHSQQFRLLPKDTSLDMDFSIYGEKVAITSIGDPLFVVVIESLALARSITTLFELLWQTARPIKLPNAGGSARAGTATRA
jgi:HTH-type transcriptional regulator, sugar sensing transcriptional regulator